MDVLLILAASYLVGSVPVAFLVVRKRARVDITYRKITILAKFAKSATAFESSFISFQDLSNGPRRAFTYVAAQAMLAAANRQTGRSGIHDLQD